MKVISATKTQVDLTAVSGVSNNMPCPTCVCCSVVMYMRYVSKFVLFHQL